MKYPLLLLICITAFFKNTHSQVYGNEWIHYDQSYYTFKIITDGVYRIPYSSLLNSGIPVGSINGSNFQIFNKGKEVPVYVSTNAVFTANDFIEFYAVHNDGEWDSTLYAFKEWQPNDRLSLFNDTASYYLTWNTQTNNNRFVATSNNITNHPPKDPYCLYTFTEVYGKPRGYANFQRGEPAIYGQAFYDSDFSNTEGYSGDYFNKSTTTYTAYTPYPYAAGPPPSLITKLIGWGNVTHSMSITLNGNSIYNETYFGFLVQTLNLGIPSISYITSPNTSISFSTAASTASSDWNSIGWIDLKYPREFNFDNQSNIFFNLPLSGANQYVEAYNFDEMGSTPILYDFTNKLRLEAVVQNDTDKFLLPTSSQERRLLLFANDTVSVIKKIDSLKLLQFTDFSEAANQGNFIIITHPFFLKDSTGHNYVEDYKNYKNANGYNAVVVNILELYDQFGDGIQTHPAAIRKFTDYIVDHWPAEERHLFLIGKGMEFHPMWDNPDLRKYCYVPTLGYPGSDILLTAKGSSPVPRIPTGRLACLTPGEIGIYLDKATLFTSAQYNPFQTIENKAWMKNILHLGGGASIQDQTTFKNYLNKYEGIIEDTLFGGNVISFFKNQHRSD
jgi:hypothetical protein